MVALKPGMELWTWLDKPVQVRLLRELVLPDKSPFGLGMSFVWEVELPSGARQYVLTRRLCGTEMLCIRQEIKERVAALKKAEEAAAKARESVEALRVQCQGLLRGKYGNVSF